MDPLVAFAICIAAFHLSEYFLAFIYQREDLSASSFLFSKDYGIAMVAGVAEYVLEWLLIPQSKANKAVFFCGLTMVVAGELIRKAGMITAGSNFTHELKMQKREGHTLVRTGIYSYVRHPGYLGWFVWAIGTQVMLSNPICTCGFYFVSSRFMKERIRIEEEYLRSFFGEAYRTYAARVPVLIPFLP
mmetsp:Transcript_8100/g.23234  ORF Transcript_8100/g.23234 Transcript_8100/m.23234 type:complete len:188 (+) Transcript_8100:181-744(+)